MSEPLIDCPDCEGAGEHVVCPRPGLCSHEDDRFYPCRSCNQEGTIEPSREAEVRAEMAEREAMEP